ncbi:MAG TPA: hypothetical protein VNE63_20285 [Candidatus Acidoferrales bacterium]|nr:hypothetical protein [Candidatus Acidoferrales bacterium]
MRSPLCLSAVLLVISCYLSSVVGASPSSSEAQDAAQSSQIGVPSTASSESTTIPGPLHSFLRMASIGQKVSREEVLPLLARNVSMEGYQEGKETEYLVLLKRYLDQARELEVLAGPEGVLRVTNCADGKPLLAILGYRLRQPCGPNTSVETADPDRAFLTIDSGFPLATLEETLRGGKPFSYPFSSSSLPMLFTQNELDANGGRKRGIKGNDGKNDAVDSLLHDPKLARLYWAMSRIDSETVNSLRQAPGVRKLLPFAAVLDFYGSQISIRYGHVVVPGGEPAEAGWKNLVGASPEAPAEFVTKLLEKDEGWTAAYFDVLSRISREQQAYFTEPQHLERFYQALRGQDVSPGPARPVFRPAPGLLLFVSQLQVDPNGQPHIPGNVEVWKGILLGHRKDSSKVIREWAKRASRWGSPEQVVDGMFGLSRVTSPGSPLEIFLTLNDVDRNRSSRQRLSAGTAHLLAAKFSKYGDQYSVFSEFPSLNNVSITRFVNVAEAIDGIHDHALRANTLGIFQANVGLWQILARQREISGNLNDSWLRVISPFGTIASSVSLLDAGRTSLQEILRAASGKPDLSQDEVIALLAGPTQSSPEGQQVRQEIATRIRTVMDDQRLISLDTLFGLADGLNRMSEGDPAPDNLLSLARDLREFEMPKPFFTPTERTAWAAGLYNTSHTTLQMRTDLTKVIQAPGSSAELANARGELAPFLRDTLVGLNYAYYEPPAAQALHSDPLFVRSHDFTGDTSPGAEYAWQTPRLFGRGWTAAGGAHLTGSLADLPYVLAGVEQDFTVPDNVQALIWEEMVPGLVSSAVLSRWWGVTKNELHAVTLYQRTGEELLVAAAKDAQLRQTVMNILSDRMLPDRAAEVEASLREGQFEKLLPEMKPAELFYLAEEYRRRFPGDNDHWGAAGRELQALSQQFPDEVSSKRISEDFGVPHPTIEKSDARELLNVKPFPSFMGYPSRLLAECWDSNNLYWARLLDEMGYPPEDLNTLVPEFTHRMVEKIFASDFEDWPALLRAMHETGEEFRRGQVASLSKGEINPGP